LKDYELTDDSDGNTAEQVPQADRDACAEHGVSTVHVASLYFVSRVRGVTLRGKNGIFVIERWSSPKRSLFILTSSIPEMTMAMINP
jgi:hypothetical protein